MSLTVAASVAYVVIQNKKMEAVKIQLVISNNVLFGKLEILRALEDFEVNLFRSAATVRNERKEEKGRGLPFPFLESRNKVP